MKKKYSFIAVLLIAVILVFGCLFFQNRSHEEKEEKKTLRVGVTLYRGDDSFINNLCGKMEEKAKRELGMLPDKEFSPEDIRGKFVEGTTHLKRRKASGRKPVSFGIILIIIAFLLYLWHYLATGSWSF